jgi:hypothetical protein
VFEKGIAMQTKSTLLATTLLAVVFVFAAVAGAADHQYIGATKCKTCHNTEKKGKIYDKWLETAHSKAYTNLASEASLKIAKEKGIEDPQKSEACLGCHVAGYAAKAEMKGEKYSMEEGVTCEACHGPGGDYFKISTMKGLVTGEVKAADVGFVMPDSTTCVTCHNEKSPTFKGFKFAEMFPKIEHKVPAEK